MAAMALMPKPGCVGAEEKPYPGSEGATTWNAWGTVPSAAASARKEAGQVVNWQSGQATMQAFRLRITRRHSAPSGLQTGRLGGGMLGGGGPCLAWPAS